MFETPEGFLVCVGVKIARTGTMEYHEKELDGAGIEGDQNGMIQIYRDEKEVFRPATIKSFEGKAFVITHPEDLVGPENWSKLAKGVMQNVRRGKADESEDLIADLLITDARAIELVKNGMREVSCGYEADYEQTSPGKGVQTNIIGNHLALVDQGRAGEAYAINDHKGVKTMNPFEKILGLFAKDPEAIKAMKVAIATADGKTKTKDEDMVGDEAPAWADDLKKSIDAMNATVANMAQPTTAAKDKDVPPVKKDEPPVKDADPLEAIMQKLEAMESRLAKLEGGTTDADEDDDEDAETDDDGVGSDVVSDSDDDEDEDEGEETKDDGVGADVMSGDSASRIEILAPGLELDAKDKKAKVTALKTCFATKDGKRIIGALSAGKTPKWNDAKVVDHLFVAASEVLKAKRTRDNAKTKFADAELIDGTPESKVMTAEKMNELNAKHYAQKTH